MGGSTRRAWVGKKNGFDIISKDYYGNKRETGGDMYLVTIEKDMNESNNKKTTSGHTQLDDDEEEVVDDQNVVRQQYQADVTDNNDGTYLVTYALKQRGVYRLSVRLVVTTGASMRGGGIGGTKTEDGLVEAEHVQGSPFELWVE